MVLTSYCTVISISARDRSTEITIESVPLTCVYNCLGHLSISHWSFYSSIQIVSSIIVCSALRASDFKSGYLSLKLRLSESLIKEEGLKNFKKLA